MFRLQLLLLLRMGLLFSPFQGSQLRGQELLEPSRGVDEEGVPVSGAPAQLLVEELEVFLEMHDLELFEVVLLGALVCTLGLADYFSKGEGLLKGPGLLGLAVPLSLRDFETHVVCDCLYSGL